jgi:hypothetical protein
MPSGVFDARVTRHIMSSSPPRTTAIITQEKVKRLVAQDLGTDRAILLTFPQTFQHFDEQLKHLQFVCNFTQVEPTYHSINEFYIEFSYLVPDVVARSRLHV